MITDRLVTEGGTVKGSAGMTARVAARIHGLRRGEGGNHRDVGEIEED